VSDTQDNGTAEDEMISEDLLALLYPDEDAPAPVAAMGDLDELEDLKSLRSLFREMPEEEPSAAVSNKLLALAAQHAPKKEEESKGFFLWLSDFFLPAVYHPGLAAAASLVLVAGLGLTLYVNGKSQVAEPQVSSQAVAPSELRDEGDFAGTASLLPATETVAAEPAPAAAEDPADSLQAELAEDEGREGGADQRKNDAYYGLDGNKTPARLGDSQGKALGGVRGGSGSGPGANIAESKSTRRREAPVKSAPLVKKPKAAKGKAGGKASDGLLKDLSSGDSLDLKKNKKEVEKERSAGKGATTAAPAPDPEPRPEPPPPPPAKPAESPDRAVDKAPAPVETDAEEADDDLDDSGAGEDESKSAPDPREKAAGLHQKALGFAKKNNCDQVKSLGQQIRKLSSVYYDRVFLSDKKLKACLAPVVKKKK
jgi:hypothetical protein